jgi:RNA polymerase sigma-70 factor (ECF subfamily)
VWGTEKESRVAGPQPAEIRLPSDEDLMAWIQAKDSKGLDLLFTRYSRLVFGIALRILNDKSEAEEVVQETFFSLYQKALLFDPGKGSAKSWIVQIAFSRSRDRRAHLLRRGFYSGTDIESLHDTLQGQDDTEREVGLRSIARICCRRLKTSHRCSAPRSSCSTSRVWISGKSVSG